MTNLIKYRDHFIPVKYFLNCYRALSDGRSAIQHLENMLKEEHFFLSNWKVTWIGACAILRTSVTLFQKDKQSCLDGALRQEIENEWELIRSEKSLHPIFWEFLRKERDNIIHAYEWGAYEMWMDSEGALKLPQISLLSVRPDDARSVLIMRGGLYSGQNSLGLLKDSAAWIEERIYSAIRRAGYEPEEYRNIATFEKRPPYEGGGLLDLAAPETQNDRETNSNEDGSSVS